MHALQGERHLPARWYLLVSTLRSLECLVGSTSHSGFTFNIMIINEVKS